ncbi:hypothetical protein ACFLIM_32790 [Nonomuraea sp. M3C6]|uniref:Uncharacterized protein n=1 Tax=Nonomuraea marmarensis TaxID=3351344 RepID=A0ABW7AKX5_9ACTN
MGADELLLVTHHMGGGVGADEHIQEQIGRNGGALVPAQRGGDVAVDRERRPTRPWAGTLDQSASGINGEVDLEPVVGEGVVPQHDHPVADLVDQRVGVGAQHPGVRDGKDAHLVLIGMEVQIQQHVQCLMPGRGGWNGPPRV